MRSSPACSRWAKRPAFRSMAPTALGSNSLIDLVVFGRATGLHLKETLKPNGRTSALPKDAADLRWRGVDHFRNAKGGSPTAEIRTGDAADHAEARAVFRDSALLPKGKDKLMPRSTSGCRTSASPTAA
jgi:succinate dehydrogenase/fumarate reductase flavoprotein subunit